ncbi:MAG TPA: glucose 1-dehydrogenase [Candidatus Acidoferrum sp.]|nr:glucose 1-dehydrogenase [Candidatus Acidoferrum sp.]
MTSNQKLMALFDLTGKTALVTGASRGIGMMAATTLAEAGADVIVCSRKRASLENVVEQIRSVGREALALEIDVSNHSRVQEAFAEGIRSFGKLNILINSAGTNFRKPATDYTESEWNQVVSVNLLGTFFCSQEAGKQMIAQQTGGKIVNLASLLTGYGVPVTNIVPYATSKAGIAGMTRSLALEWAKYRINVNALGPGYIRTELTRAIHENPNLSSAIVSRIPIGRWGDPEDLKGAFLFLSSSASDYMTGQILWVDGGWAAN